jgi:hypothetical protein
MSKHFVQRLYERLGKASARRFLAQLHSMIDNGAVPPDGNHGVAGIGTVIVKQGRFITFLGPEMVAV